MGIYFERRTSGFSQEKTLIRQCKGIVKTETDSLLITAPKKEKGHKDHLYLAKIDKTE